MCKSCPKITVARFVPRDARVETKHLTHDGGFAVADLVHQASDDQVALAICFGAVAFCGLIMYFSHHVGRLTGHIRLSTGTDRGLPQPMGNDSTNVVSVVPKEKAA
jgi:hypothetical protein